MELPLSSIVHFSSLSLAFYFFFVANTLAEICTNDIISLICFSNYRFTVSSKMVMRLTLFAHSLLIGRAIKSCAWGECNRWIFVLLFLPRRQYKLGQKCQSLIAKLSWVVALFLQKWCLFHFFYYYCKELKLKWPKNYYLIIIIAWLFSLLRVIRWSNRSKIG